MVHVIPTKQLGVKAFGSVTAAGTQLDPTKRSRFMFDGFLHTCFSHSQISFVTPSTPSKQVEIV
jgi:hypothetical protein